MLDVTVVLLDDGHVSTALLPIEVFSAAGALWAELRGETPAPRFRVTTASLTGAAIRGPHGGLTLAPQTSIDQITRTEIIIIPTSGLALDEKLLENSALLPWLAAHHAAGAYLAGVCMGAAYLAEAGLLDGRRATTHWAVAGDLARRYPKVEWLPDHFVTEDNRLLCGGGITAAADVSLYLVEKLCGHEVAVQAAKSLLLTLPRSHQSGYALLPISPPHDDDRIRAVETYLATHFREGPSTEVLADQAGMGERTFIRRFKAATGRLPGAYLQAVRIETAKAMLERDGAPIQTVSSHVGYEDAAFFRALFKRATGMTPAAYRDRFAAMDVRRAANAGG